MIRNLPNAPTGGPSEFFTRAYHAYDDNSMMTLILHYLLHDPVSTQVWRSSLVVATRFPASYFVLQICAFLISHSKLRTLALANSRTKFTLVHFLILSCASFTVLDLILVF